MSDKTWDQLFIEMTRLVASKSKDTSTKCGCVIVGPDNEVRTTGYNGLPRGVEYKQERTEVRPEKYFWFSHSEENAVCNAARMGLSLKGCKAYVTGPPCAACTRMMIQAGVKEIIIPELHNFRDKEKETRWLESCNAAMAMMSEAGVVFRKVSGM